LRVGSTAAIVSSLGWSRLREAGAAPWEGAPLRGRFFISF
jgi:hypothetical protein